MQVSLHLPFPRDVTLIGKGERRRVRDGTNCVCVHNTVWFFFFQTGTGEADDDDDATGEAFSAT